ncbi:MAG: site-specific integrase [bacterium]|nr:site-specific integrase [bacterium]
MSIALKTKSTKVAGIVIRRQRNGTGDHSYLDIYEGAVRVREFFWSHVKSDRLNFVQKKTGDYTHIPLADEALTLLGERPSKKSALVFALPTTDDLFNRYLKRWVKVAGIDKHVTSHIARHTFATLLITQGNDLYAVQHLLGHRDIRVTQLYAKLVDERKKAAVNSLPSIHH